MQAEEAVDALVDFLGCQLARSVEVASVLGARVPHGIAFMSE
ncbi:MAG: hypothetical protein N3C12_13535 [Candidatus Binatia bacterium]|nr:hypothetical protein [Candidatus Binatia bacterium]